MVGLLVGIRLLVGVCVGTVVFWSKSTAEQSKKTSSSESAAASIGIGAGGVGVGGVWAVT